MSSAKTVTIPKSKYKKLVKKKKELKRKLKEAVHKHKTPIDVLDSGIDAVREDSQSQDSSLADNIKFQNVRDYYFNNLIHELKRNREQDTLDFDAMALALEQKALLASLDSEIYRKRIKEIIAAVQKTTSESQLFPTVNQVKIEPPSQHSKEPSPDNGYHEDVCVSEAASAALPVARVLPTATESIVFDQQDSNDSKRLKPISRVQPQTKPAEQREGLEPGLSDFIFQCKNEKDEVEKTLLEEEGHDRDNLDIENLLQILEGTEEEENNMDSRVEEMRGLFGYESPKRAEPVKEERDKHGISVGSQIKIHKNERYIFLYKVLTRCARMPAQRFFRTRKSFVNYFGNDSDFEQEDDFSDYDTYIASCSRRILPTVVRFVMPFYKQGRIIGGSYMFKNLVRRIADSLVDVTNYPSDEEVSKFVSKFFPPGKKFMDITDVWCYQVD